MDDRFEKILDDTTELLARYSVPIRISTTSADQGWWSARGKEINGNFYHVMPAPPSDVVREVLLYLKGVVDKHLADDRISSAMFSREFDEDKLEADLQKIAKLIEGTESQAAFEENEHREFVVTKCAAASLAILQEMLETLAKDDKRRIHVEAALAELTQLTNG